MNKHLYIINPAGHGGKGNAAWDAFKTLWPDPINPERVMVTGRPGHAREIATAIQGYDVLVAVGGDGTIGEIMSGIMDRQGPKPRLALIPTGTGNDIGRNIGILSLADAVAALQRAQACPFDLVRIDCQIDGVPGHGYGFLFGMVGFSAIPMMKPWMKRLLGPKSAYYLATFLQILAYRAPRMTINTRDRRFNERTYMVIAGNAEYAAGGSMRVSPEALTDDGLMNVTVIPHRSRLNVVTRLFPRIATGTHINEPGVAYFTDRCVEVHSDPPAVIDVDGDLFGTTPATFTLCQHAIQILCPTPQERSQRSAV
ncbi:MAG: diacylglycerol kinase family lipid kinase [Planctomycetes bacterium]|nr:diacylglycerol kinase family lipid kinase [Planctomycetota bacterium]